MSTWPPPSEEPDSVWLPRRWRREAGQIAQRRMSMQAALRIATILVWALLIFGFLRVASWYSPVGKPRLLILTGEVTTPTLPEHPALAGNLKAVRSQGHVFDFRNAPESRMTLTMLRDAVAQLSEQLHIDRASEHGSEMTHVLYVNLPGIAVPTHDDSLPVLVPSDINVELPQQRPPLDQFYPVANLLEALAIPTPDVPPDSEAETQCPPDNEPAKIVILDCQIWNTSLSLGSLRNEFAQRVQHEFERRKGRLHRTYVLLSCSAGEISWADPQRGESVFTTKLIEGLNGAADGWVRVSALSQDSPESESAEPKPSDGKATDAKPSDEKPSGEQPAEDEPLDEPADRQTGERDRRIDLAELDAYVHAAVATWARDRRADAQTTTLLVSGPDPSELVLTALEDDSQSQQVTSSSTATADNDETATADEGAAAIDNEGEAEDEGESKLDGVLSELERNWIAYFDLASRDPSLPYPYPELWRDTQDALLRAEDRIRWNQLEEAHAAAARAGRNIAQLQKSAGKGIGARIRRSDGQPADVFSLPLLELFGHDVTPAPLDEESETVDQPSEKAPPAGADKAASTPDEPATQHTPATDATQTDQGTAASDDAPSDARDEKPAELTAGQIAWLVNQVLINAEPSAAGELLNTRPTTLAALPAEAELLRMLTTQGIPTDNADEIRQILRLREHCERTVTAAGPASTTVFPVIRPIHDGHERQLHFLEDTALLGPHTVPTASVEPQAPEQLLAAFQTTAQQSQQLADAYAVWVRAVVEAPRWFDLVVRKRWPDLENDPPETQPKLLEVEPVAADTRRLLTAMIDLRVSFSALIATPPQTNSELAVRVETITASTNELEGALEALHQWLKQLAAQVQERTSDETHLTRRLWHSLDKLFSVPWALKDDPAEMARTRIQWLRDIRMPFPSGVPRRTGTPARPVPNHDRDQTVRLWFALTVPSRRTDPEWLALSHTSNVVYSAWWQRYALMTRADTQELRQSALATRLLPGRAVRNRWTSHAHTPSERLRHHELAAFLLWQADRLMNSFWAGHASATEPWFEKTAAICISEAASVVESQAESDLLTAPVQDRLGQLVGFHTDLIARACGNLMETPPSVKLVGVDQMDFDVTLTTPESFPAGLVRFDVRSQSRLFTSMRLTDTSNKTVSKSSRFRLARETLGGITSVTDVEFQFRGRTGIRPLAADALSEIDGPGWTWRRGPNDTPQLTVYRSEADLQKVDLLFVLDCSRSMQGPRITALKDTLLEFSRLASESGINIGVRVFGDQQIWNGTDTSAERLARRDTRLLLPVEPFPGDKFESLVRSLKVRGETPLFYSLIEAIQQDFTKASEDHARQIVLISDGADNWASVGLRPDVNDIQTAFQASPTTINAIGFQTDATGFSQLQRIAAVTGGQAVYVAEATDLLRNVFGLTGLFTWKLFRQSPTGELNQVHEAFVGYEPKPIEFPVGMYTLSIFDSTGRKVAERKDLTLLPSQCHELIHVGETINYAPPRLQNDVADIVAPDGNRIFRIMKADYVPAGRALLPVPGQPAAHRGALNLTIALQSADATAWTPGTFDLLIQPNSKATYAITGLHASGQPVDMSSPPGLLPNVPGHHFPVWHIALENWPAGESAATFTLLTPESSTATPEITVPLNGPLPLPIPDGPKVTRARFPAKRRLVAPFLPSATSPSARVSLDQSPVITTEEAPAPITRIHITGPVTLYRRFETGQTLTTTITAFDSEAPEPTTAIRSVTPAPTPITEQIDLRLRWVNQ